jgi:MHS family proline/betaine transporter-like MFS transporter
MTRIDKTEPSSAGTAAHAMHPARAIVVASIGNALEWFDLIIFGFLSVTISKQFFPATDATTALLLTFATFGVSFVVRPLGGILLGIYADRAGRMKALSLAAGLMMFGTGMIAFMPSYHSIGITATFGILIARLIQGFSAGGEFASATAFLAEQSEKHKGFFASWQVASQGFTTLLASGAGVALSTWLTPEDLESWGWRLPFYFGMLIGPVALYIRIRVPETPEFQAAKIEAAPLRATLSTQKWPLLISIGVSILGTVSSYVVLLTPTFAVRELGITASAAFTATLATGIVQMSLSPVVGWLGDRIGRAPIMIGSAAAMLLAVLPLYAWLVSSPTAETLLIVQIIYGVLMTGYFASQPAFLAELFPVQVRTTAMSLGYNFAVTLFGGFAPLIITTLIATTGSLLSPSYYVMFAAVLSLTAVIASLRGRPVKAATSGRNVPRTVIEPSKT